MRIRRNMNTNGLNKQQYNKQHINLKKTHTNDKKTNQKPKPYIKEKTNPNENNLTQKLNTQKRP